MAREGSGSPEKKSLPGIVPWFTHCFGTGVAPTGQGTFPGNAEIQFRQDFLRIWTFKAAQVPSAPYRSRPNIGLVRGRIPQSGNGPGVYPLFGKTPRLFGAATFPQLHRARASNLFPGTESDCTVRSGRPTSRRAWLRRLRSSPSCGSPRRRHGSGRQSPLAWS